MNSTINNIIAYNGEYFYSNLLCLSVIGAICLLSILIVRNKSQDNTIAFLLFCCLIYRIGLSILYYYIMIDNPKADTHDYYLMAMNTKEMADLYGYGFKFIVFTLYPFVKTIKLTYFSCFMLNCMYGFIGSAFLISLLIDQGKDWNISKWYISVVLFWPGLNFWTSMIGKDSLIFLGLSMLLYATSSFRKRVPLAIISLLLIVHIRPYLAMIIVPCLVLSLTVSSGGLNWPKRIVIIGLFLGSIIPISVVFLKMFGLETIDYETATEILKYRQSNWDGGSSIDISNTFILLKILIYLYRPLFFDARSVPMLLSSLENIFLIIITFRLLTPKLIAFWVKTKSMFISFCLIYFVVGVTLLSVSTSNLGTASRQKNMVVVVLLLLNALYYSYSNYNKKMMFISQFFGAKSEMLDKKWMVENSGINGKNFFSGKSAY
jgi:hypothetical protein